MLEGIPGRMSANPGQGRTENLRAIAGAPGGNRTPNLLVRSQTLYPLSYGRLRNSIPGQSRLPG